MALERMLEKQFDHQTDPNGLPMVLPRNEQIVQDAEVFADLATMARVKTQQEMEGKQREKLKEQVAKYFSNQKNQPLLSFFDGEEHMKVHTIGPADAYLVEDDNGDKILIPFHSIAMVCPHESDKSLLYIWGLNGDLMHVTSIEPVCMANVDLSMIIKKK